VQVISNLRLGVRLGAAFGLLVVALVVVSLTGVLAMGSLADRTNSLADRDVPALASVMSAGSLAQANGSAILTHLYVEDGDLGAQDATAKRIAANAAAIDKHLATAERALTSPEAREAFAAFAEAYEGFVAVAEPTLETSRQETVDEVEERDGSRSA
jgi:methyl-accepting chemotaxis protein